MIDDEADVLYSFRRIFASPEIELTTAGSGEEALKLIPKLKPDLVLMDIRMGGLNGLETLRRLRQTDARLPVIMMTAYGTTQAAIEAMKLGAYDYLLKPFDVPKLKQIVAEALKAARAMRQVVSYEPLLESEDYDLGIVGRCDAMQSVFKLIGQLSAADATALITGESGTGKELVARAIYSHSRRSSQPFLAINCAAIPENLLESELFGHEKGAFTGATNQRIGKFEQCHGGTLFLDEIGDMTLATQTKILRVLQSGSFERVGGNQAVQVDVRVIAATNKPLETAVANKQFREDLFYRLNVVRIALPPLRERAADVRLLVNYFLKKFAEEQASPSTGSASGQVRPAGPGRGPKSISLDALALLERYAWPGNVRELENVIRRALVVTKGDAILPADLPSELTAQRSWPAPGPGAAAAVLAEPPLAALRQAQGGAHEQDITAAGVPALARALFQHARHDPNLRLLPAVERELVIQALQETRGNQVQAAKLLGITRSTLRKRIAKFGIKQDLAIG